jgi:prepilin-type N-terminal cleavage/methylation domain-containing protein
MMKINIKAFTLLEILLVLAIFGMLAGLGLAFSGSFFDGQTIDAERKNLREIRDAVVQSFNEADPNRNIAALAGLTGIGTTATIFDSETNLNTVISADATVMGNSWQDKVSRVMNYVQTIGDVIPSNRADTIWFNSRYWRRVMLVGPTNEMSQRYLILTFTMPVGQPLVFPATSPSGSIFNDIWSNNWNSSGALAPAAWTGVMTADQLAVWNSNELYNRTNASRLIVERVNQPKYPVILVNNSVNDTVWIDIGTYANAMILGPGGGVTRSNAIPEFANGVLIGTWVIVRRGLDAASAFETQRFPLSGPANLTVQ